VCACPADRCFADAWVDAHAHAHAYDYEYDYDYEYEYEYGGWVASFGPAGLLGLPPPP
jgi:hypothetical protein